MTDWQVTDTNCTLLIYKSTFCLVFHFTFFLKIGVEKVIELIFWFNSFVFFHFLKSKMKWMNKWKNKNKIKNSPLEKDREEEEEEEEKGVNCETMQSSPRRRGNWGDQMMLGPCHLATSEPVKTLAQWRGEWLMLKNSSYQWPPASEATASTITH